ncbi:MAG: nicotinamidase [Candidatus Puniceispirillum sp. TMED52]|nr:nicotinamidase/pyrazinamidase [SAR116 cluster bacterium]OUU44946.1 MAG: nicotinamidase [Candidatus Puniceispirillum sp. TMED52]
MTTAFIAIDVQNDFCPGGALAVNDGDAVVAPINALINTYDHVILTQDWHPSGHSSFASEHDGHDPLTTITMPYGEQTLWPDHCVQGTNGAMFHDHLNIDRAELIIRKGYRREVDSYSAFFENDHKTTTGLTGYLNDRGITHVVMAGLATDFCVAFSALDARKCGFSCQVVMDASRAIDLGGSLAAMTEAMAEAGVELITMADT